MSHKILIFSFVFSTLLTSGYTRSFLPSKTGAEWPTLNGLPPLFFGHQGDKFYLPEHTTGSYWLGAVEGADYVEPDIVLTKDAVPVCFHDLALKRSSDVASHPEFAHLRGNYSVIIDGENRTIFDDWLVVHFTLEELRTLKVRQQPNGVRLQDFNQLYPIATFQEFLDTIHKASWILGKPIGIIPEIKHPQFHNTVFPSNTSHFFEDLVLSALRANGYPLNPGDLGHCTHEENAFNCGPLILQSFDNNTVKYLSTVTSAPMVELMMLIHPNVYLLTPAGFDQIATYSHYICLHKEYMYTGVEAEVAFRGWEYDEQIVDNMGGFFSPEQFIPEGHSRSVKMALFTIPDSREGSGRGCAVACDPTNKEEEMTYFFQRGVDGLFVENVPESILMRMKHDFELQLNQTISTFRRRKGFKAFVPKSD